MEKLNSKGHTSIECLLILPLIMILVVGSVMLYITTYQGSKNLMNETKDAVLKREAIDLNIEISYLHYEFEKHIYLSVLKVDGMTLHNYVAFAIDMLEQVTNENE